MAVAVEEDSGRGSVDLRRGAGRGARRLAEFVAMLGRAETIYLPPSRRRSGAHESKTAPRR